MKAITWKLITKFHVKFHENSMEKITNYKKNFHEIPGGTSRYIHGIFLDPELRKLLVGTFFLGGKMVFLNKYLFE